MLVILPNDINVYSGESQHTHTNVHAHPDTHTQYLIHICVRRCLYMCKYGGADPQKQLYFALFCIDACLFSG